MTRGALIFAFNNEHTDYVHMAAWCAKNVRKHLDIPVAVVTNSTDNALLKEFDCVIQANAHSGGDRWFQDYNTHVTWYNAGRTDAYTLSPWDHTLVLDSDYVVTTSQLNLLFESPSDFQCFRHSFDITNPQRQFLKTFGRHHMPMWWATVMCFRRSNTARYIFDAMQMVRNHWQHYRDLYGIMEDTYRNDYALSIALGIVSGHTGVVDEIPWAMPASLPEHTLELDATTDHWTVTYTNDRNQPSSMGFAGLDFHAMGKQSLAKVIAHG